MEQLFQHIDIYCERVGTGFWNEPLNALTNASFLIAAIVAWQSRNARFDRLVAVLCGILAAIGVGSFFNHTFAVAWAAAVDVAAIAAFVVAYLYGVNRRCLRFGKAVSILVAMVAVVTISSVAGLVGQISSFLAGSSSYVGIAVLIFAYAAWLARRLPGFAMRLAAGGAILCVSIAFRAADEPVCSAFPFGLHWMWHILNGVMLFWMIRAIGMVSVEASFADERRTDADQC